MYKNKFLDKIGYSSNKSTSSFVFGMKKDRRAKLWKKQRKKWGGYDTRVGWNLRILLLETLYTWLKIYLNDADGYIDLSHYKFEINSETLTQKECIVRMIDDLEFVLKNLDNDKVRETVNAKVKDCFHILGECLFVLWW